MKLRLIAGIALFMNAHASMGIDIIAGPVTNAANGQVYFLLDRAGWEVSQDAARRMGGHLATIDDGEEQNWVFHTFAAWGGVYRTLWIGLNDKTREGTFRWVSGQPTVYLNWSFGEPNGDEAHNAVHMLPPNSHAPGRWNDVGEGAEWWGEGPTLAAFHAVVEVDPLKVRIAVTQVAISWNSTAEVKYQVQFTEASDQGVWRNLGPIVAGTGGPLVGHDTVHPQAHRLYRVISVP